MINTVDQTRWRMVGVAYIDEILLLQRTFTRMISVALICGGLLSLGVASLTAYFVTRPIHHLQQKMRQVENGDLHSSIAEEGFQEIRALSATFNHMLQSLRDLMDQVVREQEAKRLYELNALQAQINPHFLYNTLDSIIWMEERGHSKEAILAVSALAKLFRISISQGRAIISVQEELEHARNYLIIQKMRFKNKFTYEIEATEEALHLRTVKLIVQPLVENAVHHAIDAYGEGVLHISVRARRAEALLLITVADDGVGIPAEKAESILRAPPGKSGIGLRNVHERIQLTCGKDYGLRVHSVEDEGTTVTIRLPADLAGDDKGAKRP
jgi:two-component system sensor histidine kinase YesM